MSRWLGTRRFWRRTRHSGAWALVPVALALAWGAGCIEPAAAEEKSRSQSATQNAPPWAPYPASYNEDQVREDFSLFRRALEEAHPGLYRYRTKEEMDGVFAKAETKLGEAHTEVGLFKLLALVISQIGDGHTSIDLSEGFRGYLLAQPSLLPFKLRIIERRPYIYLDYTHLSDGPHPELVGAEILEFSGHSAEDTLSLMTSYVPLDGANVAGKYRSLEFTPVFGVLYQMLYGPMDRFPLRIRRHGASEDEEVTIAGVPQKAVDQLWKGLYLEDARKDVHSVTFPEGVASTALIRIPHFVGEDLPQIFRDGFQAIEKRGVRNLVIDLRGNGGGRGDYGSLLYSYLTEKPFRYYDSLQVMGLHLEVLDYSDRAGSRLSEEQAVPNDQGTYDFTAKQQPMLGGMQQPSKPIFKGQVFVLVDGHSFSATSEFCSVLDHNREVVFIGEESAGGYHGNTSGASAIVTLPHTKMRLQVPLVRYNVAVEGRTPVDRGIIPNHYEPGEIGDYLDESDSVLERAFELIRDREP